MYKKMEIQKISRITVVKAIFSFTVSVLIYTMFYFVSSMVAVFNVAIDMFSFRDAFTSETLVQKGRVLLRCKLTLMELTSPTDFLCLFTTRVDPDYVLRPNVSLYCVTKHEAVFIETESDCNIYSSDENPFLYVAQFCRAKYVIKMSIQSFHVLAEKIGDPSLPVIWVSNTGRCGSTMLCQVFESAPGTIVMSEPDVMSNISILTNHGLAEVERENILRSAIRILCKASPGTERFVVKTRSVSTALMMDISYLFPSVKQIFMYRNCLETLLSFMAISASVPSTVLLRTCIDNERISSVLPFFRRYLRSLLLSNVRNSQTVPLNTNILGLFTHVWANYILLARDAMSNNPDILPVKYEDLKENPTEWCKSIFKEMNIDPTSINESLPIFTRDSQRGSVLSQSQVKSKKARNMTNTDRIATNAIPSNYGLPHIEEDFRL